MSVALEKIYYAAMRKYGMKLLAGKKGIWHTTSWIHLVEDISVVDFLRGQELVVITGISNPDADRLQLYVEQLYAHEASGLIVNIGPFIREVPKACLEYADSVGFPVFALPWEVHLVDFSKEFCNVITHGEEVTQTLCSAYRNAIFRPQDKDGYLPFLKKEGISKDETYCMIKCMICPPAEEIDQTKLFYDVRLWFEEIMNQTQEKYVIFRHEDYFTTLVPSPDRQEIDRILEGYRQFQKRGLDAGMFHFAVSKYDLQLDDLPENFEVLSYMCKLAKRENRRVWRWEELGEWMILFSVKSTAQLVEYKNTILGELEKYDQENETEYCRILDLYLLSNGNMNAVAEKMYVHRNTVAYYLKKIEEMLGMDIYSMQDRTKLYLAFRVREILAL